MQDCYKLPLTGDDDHNDNTSEENESIHRILICESLHIYLFYFIKL